MHAEDRDYFPISQVSANSAVEEAYSFIKSEATEARMAIMQEEAASIAPPPCRRRRLDAKDVFFCGVAAQCPELDPLGEQYMR